MSPDRFDDVRLAADAVRARAHQGGPLSGASARVLPGAPPSRRPRLFAPRSSPSAATRPSAQPTATTPSAQSTATTPTAGGDEGHQLYLVIDAPTWNLVRRVGPGRETWATGFAAAVNSAARLADAATWRPSAADTGA